MKGIYKVRVGKTGIAVSYGEATYEANGKLHVYIYRRVVQTVASKSVFNFMMSHKATTLKNGDYLYKANWEKEASGQQEENTMNVLEKALETTEKKKKKRERRHYFATKGEKGVSIFSYYRRPDLYIFETWIARKKWIEEQEPSIVIETIERDAKICKQAYSRIVDGVRMWDSDVHFM